MKKCKKTVAILLLPVLCMAILLSSCGQQTYDPLEGVETTTVQDDYNRDVEVPAEITRIAASGATAQMILMTIAPDMLVGLSSSPSTQQMPYFPEEMWTLPTFGQFYGSKSNLNMEALIDAQPQIVIDLGDRKVGGGSDMQEIQRQTGADLFEIVPIPAYSDDYNTVLMEAQRDQHNQARPAISNPPADIDAYDVILLGYPNWWASIPMPIAAFLESYDFSGKTILPFCSHGGGRFGQSLTAIAKLAPQAIIAPGLSVHYSGGSSLSGDIHAWLESQGVLSNP